MENGFQNYINDLNELRAGSISIGGTNLFVSFLLPPILSRFTARYPAVDIRLTEASTEELTEKLFSGQLDLMIDNSHMDPSVYEKEFVCEEHLVLTVPKAFPSAAGPPHFPSPPRTYEKAVTSKRRQPLCPWISSGMIRFCF